MPAAMPSPLHSDAPTFIATDAWLSRSDFDAVDLNVVRSTSSDPSMTKTPCRRPAPRQGTIGFVGEQVGS